MCMLMGQIWEEDRRRNQQVKQKESLSYMCLVTHYLLSRLFLFRSNIFLLSPFALLLLLLLLLTYVTKSLA